MFDVVRVDVNESFGGSPANPPSIKVGGLLGYHPWLKKEILKFLKSCPDFIRIRDGGEITATIKEGVDVIKVYGKTRSCMRRLVRELDAAEAFAAF